MVRVKAMVKVIKNITKDMVKGKDITKEKNMVKVRAMVKVVKNITKDMVKGKDITKDIGIYKD